MKNKFKISLHTILGCCILFTIIPHTASAWTWNNKGIAYNGSDMCVQSDAGIDHAIPNLFSGNLAYANTYALSPGCGNGLINQYAAAKVDVYKWSGTAWNLCRSSNWSFAYTNIVTWGDINRGGPTGPSVTLDYGGSSSCGSGYYGAWASSYVWNGTQWLGGGVWSGYEFVP